MKNLRLFEVPHWLDMGRLGDQPISLLCHYNASEDYIDKVDIIWSGLDITHLVMPTDVDDFLQKAIDFIRARMEVTNYDRSYDSWRDSKGEAV